MERAGNFVGRLSWKIGMEGRDRAQPGAQPEAHLVHKDPKAQRAQGLSRGHGPRPQAPKLSERGLGQGWQMLWFWERQPQVRGQGCRSAMPVQESTCFYLTPTATACLRQTVKGHGRG